MSRKFTAFFINLSIYMYLTPIINSRSIRTNFSSSLSSHVSDDSSITYLWPLPSKFTSGNETLTVDPDLTISVSGNGGNSVIISEAFERYRNIIFKHTSGVEKKKLGSDITKLSIILHSNNEEVRSFRSINA